MVFDLRLVNDIDLHFVENISDIVKEYNLEVIDHIIAFLLFSKDKNLKLRTHY